MATSFPTSPTPTQTAKSYETSILAPRVAAVAGKDGRVSAAEAKKDPFVADAYKQSGFERPSASTVTQAGAKAMQQQAEKAAEGDGRISKADAQAKMSPLYAQAFAMLRGVGAQPVADGMVAVTLETNQASATLTRANGVYTLVTGSVSGAQGTSIKLNFDGKSIALPVGSNGQALIYRFGQELPAGYWGTRISETFEDGRQTSVFRLEKAQTALSNGALLALARTGLGDFVRDTRMKEADWQQYFPSTWDAFVAAGGAASIAAFGNGAEAEIVDNGRRLSIVDRGPYDLLTEVDLDKVTGDIVRVYVEID